MSQAIGKVWERLFLGTEKVQKFLYKLLVIVFCLMPLGLWKLSQKHSTFRKQGKLIMETVVRALKCNFNSKNSDQRVTVFRNVVLELLVVHIIIFIFWIFKIYVYLCCINIYFCIYFPLISHFLLFLLLI